MPQQKAQLKQAWFKTVSSKYLKSQFLFSMNKISQKRPKNELPTFQFIFYSEQLLGTQLFQNCLSSLKSRHLLYLTSEKMCERVCLYTQFCVLLIAFKVSFYLSFRNLYIVLIMNFFPIQFLLCLIG